MADTSFGNNQLDFDIKPTEIQIDTHSKHRPLYSASLRLSPPLDLCQEPEIRTSYINKEYNPYQVPMTSQNNNFNSIDRM
jgi:hypothetical protein